MKRVAFAVLSCLLALAACNSGDRADARFASVMIGTDMGHLAHAGDGLSTLGVPTDPDTGQAGVTVAELTVFRGGNQVYFDGSGNEVPIEGESTPVLLTSAASTTVLNLLFGTYSFYVDARDDVSNSLANGSVLDVAVNASTNVTVPLVSIISTAALTGPVAVVPNEIFDVFLTVSPPGRSDLMVPTTDYSAVFSYTGGLMQGWSDLGIRIAAECEEVVIDVNVYPEDDYTEIAATAPALTVPVSYTCPAGAGTIGVDMLPPFVEFTEPLDGAVFSNDDWVTLAGNVNDSQSGVERVDVYDGPVLIGGTTDIQPPEGDNPYSTWSLSNWWWPQDVRTYSLTVVATDNAGNESQRTITVTRTQ